MKWSKFLELQKNHPFIAHDLSWRGEPQDNKEFVRKKVGYIAFRPFGSLDLTAKETSSSTPLKSNHPGVDMGYYRAVEYQISFHVEGEADSTCLRYVTTDVGDGSIQAHIDDVTDWFESCDDFQGKQLVWERVVRRTVCGSSHTGLTSMSLEIFLFPRHYRFKPVKWEPIPAPNRATIAYLNGDALGPIVPGTLQSAW